MADALIGSSGFVGTTLLRQRGFDSTYRSTNVGDVAGRDFDTVVCAAAPAQKWVANRDPAADESNIQRLMSCLGTLRCARFILISTVDVFSVPVDVDEETAVSEQGLHAYGKHRRSLERFVTSTFPNHLVVRLAGLVGPGLRKNVVYDLHHKNNLDAINPRAVYQFYPTVNLWADVQIALERQLSLVHLTAEPTSVSEIARDGFGITLEENQSSPAPRYDVRSRYAGLFGGDGAYQYRKREVLSAVRAYAQSEAKRG